MNCVINLVDLNPDMVAAWKNEFANHPDINIHCDNILNWTDKVAVFVSACNSLLFFDGGSDLAYQQIFPDVDNKMKSWIRRYDLRDQFGGYFLPVGAATIKSFGKKRLICCSTMLLPQDVSDTRNAYNCFKLILELIDKQADVREVLVPGLCCGYGKMPYAESAKQMREAYKDHISKKNKLDMTGHLIKSLVYDPKIIRTQPRYYQNGQFFKFDRMESVHVPKNDKIEINKIE